MSINEKKLISYLIVIVPIALVLLASFFITSFYLKKVNTYFDSAKERSISKYIDSKKLQSEMWVNQLNLLFEYKNTKIEETAKLELKATLDKAYKSARDVYEKKKSKTKVLNAIYKVNKREKGSVFITDFTGKNIIARDDNLNKSNISAFKAVDGRATILEEIQKARKYKEGYIVANLYEGKGVSLIAVKDMDMYSWYMGSFLNLDKKEELVKSTLFDMISAIPMEKTDFMMLYEGSETIFISKSIQDVFDSNTLMSIAKSLSKKSTWYEDRLDGYYYFSRYYAPFDWNLIYGFDISKISEQELSKLEDLEQMLDNELEFIIKVSALIVLLVVLLSYLLSRKINIIFAQYNKEVNEKRDELEKLNKSLEQRVSDEVTAHREKDKMLIQQSKMAEMGDMLSMIAHQWRQPLNQISYIFMNIDSAYEYDELTKKYLDEKLTEGNRLLEFMSVTIDDFRNYFKPDKDKEFVLVSDIIDTSVMLMQNALELNSIEVKIDTEGRDLTYIYKNEFIQVMLNLIKNAQDVIVQNCVEEPKIFISSRCKKEKLIVEVCDNGGGVDCEIKERVFEPYFSTKESSNGTGLGLYMSKMIIEEHLNGKLSVYNSEDGACFRIEI